MPKETFGDVTADANWAIFLKLKATALFNRVASLQWIPYLLLHMRLELINELQE